MSTLIGVDCGGTHIVGQRFDTTNTMVRSVTGGPGNVVLDRQLAITNLTKVIDTLTENDHADLILIGIAGIETAGGSDAIENEFSVRYQCKVIVISDAKLALLNGLQGQDGAMVIAGTGSIIYGRQNGAFMRVGGWGPQLGDEGSAFDIAKAGMKAILTSADHGKKHPLQEPLFEALNAETIAEAVANFYAQDRKTNAKLAIVIADAADSGDLTAQQVITSCAQELATQALTIQGRFQQPAPKLIALSGSVLQHNKRFQTAFRQAIHTADAQIQCLDIPTNNAHGVIYWQRWQLEVTR